MMMRRMLFHAKSWITAAILLPVLAGCYEYVPLANATPKTGEIVTFEISDQGRVGLSERFGPGLASIEGRVTSAESDQYLINVFKVSQLNGESALWSGEAVRLQRVYVETAKGREFSPTRTTIAAITAAVVTGALIAGTMRLAGSFNGGPDESNPPKPVSIRIPIVLRP
jgi:hypothetical protein